MSLFFYFFERAAKLHFLLDIGKKGKTINLKSNFYVLSCALEIDLYLI